MLTKHVDCPACKDNSVEEECNTCNDYGWIEKPIDEEQIVFVNVYSITRHYGGPEEGGWWYNWDECLESIPVRNKHSELMVTETIKLFHRYKHGNIYSVLGGRDIAVRLEETPKESETKERPYYE